MDWPRLAQIWWGEKNGLIHGLAGSLGHTGVIIVAVAATAYVCACTGKNHWSHGILLIFNIVYDYRSTNKAIKNYSHIL